MNGKVLGTPVVSYLPALVMLAIALCAPLVLRGSH